MKRIIENATKNDFKNIFNSAEIKVSWTTNSSKNEERVIFILNM